MIVSFSGTQRGMTMEQCNVVPATLINLKATELVHGDCIGADAQAHNIALELGLVVKKRPCTLRYKRAFTAGGEVVAPPEAPLDRNHKIVDDGKVLLATPQSYQEERRSGTWATIRYARKLDRLVYLIGPDGGVVVLGN
jgi:hypothetical protein